MAIRKFNKQIGYWGGSRGLADRRRGRGCQRLWLRPCSGHVDRCRVGLGCRIGRNGAACKRSSSGSSSSGGGGGTARRLGLGGRGGRLRLGPRRIGRERQLGQGVVLELVVGPGEVPSHEAAGDAGDRQVQLAPACAGCVSNVSMAAGVRARAMKTWRGVGRCKACASARPRTSQAHTRRRADVQRRMAAPALQAACLMVAAVFAPPASRAPSAVAPVRSQRAISIVPPRKRAPYMRKTTRSLTLCAVSP